MNLDFAAVHCDNMAGFDAILVDYLRRGPYAMISAVCSALHVFRYGG